MATIYQRRWKRADFRGWKYQKLVGLGAQKRVLDVYPHLKKYPELKLSKRELGKLSFDKVLRYVMIYYSDNVLRHTMPETLRRKREAAFIAGFNFGDKTNKFGPEVERMLLCQNSGINRLIVRFIRRSENKKFLQLCVFEEARAKQMQKLIDGVEGKGTETTKYVIDNVKTLSEDIDRLERELLNDDPNEELIDMIYDEVDNNNLGISPEDIVELEKENALEGILTNPYKHIHDSSSVRTKKKTT